MREKKIAQFIHHGSFMSSSFRGGAKVPLARKVTFGSVDAAVALAQTVELQLHPRSPPMLKRASFDPRVVALRVFVDHSGDSCRPPVLP